MKRLHLWILLATLVAATHSLNTTPQNDVDCKPGEGAGQDEQILKEGGRCLTPVRSEEECRKTLKIFRNGLPNSGKRGKYYRRSIGDTVLGYDEVTKRLAQYYERLVNTRIYKRIYMRMSKLLLVSPFGCFLSDSFPRSLRIKKQFGIFNPKPSHDHFSCGEAIFYHTGGGDKMKMEKKTGLGCLCQPRVCWPCPPNTYSKGGTNAACLPCEPPMRVSKDRTKCVDPRIVQMVEEVKEDLEKEKEKDNDLSIKNSRLWAKEQVRLNHDDMMARRKNQDNEKERDFCKEEEEDGTVVFPAIDVPNEIEKIEDTTCIDSNRDELLKAFCSFSTDLDGLFAMQGRNETAKLFFPNICCKERRDTKLEVCEDLSGRIPRENIVPFALSQGGNFSRHNLYAEVSDALKRGGYLHAGMRNVLRALKLEKRALMKELDGFFEEVSLCGPRVVKEPGTQGERQLCQLFAPYGHVLQHFYNELVRAQTSPSFLDLAEDTPRLGKAIAERQRPVAAASPMQRTMDMKRKNLHYQQCRAGPTFSKQELARHKGLYCKGMNHIDLMNPSIKNVALYYLKKDLGSPDLTMLGMEGSLRYRVKDESACPSKLFEAEDISIQQVAMNADGSMKDWAAVIKLNTGDGSYLKSEMPKCEHADYLPRTDVTVNVFEDKEECCSSKDADKCKVGCKLTPLLAKNGKRFSKEVTVTGTVYEVKDSAARRRRLLQRGGAGNCRL